MRKGSQGLCGVLAFDDQIDPAIGRSARIPIANLLVDAWVGIGCESFEPCKFVLGFASPGGGGTRKSFPDEMTKVVQLPAAGSICCAFIAPATAIVAAKNEVLNLCFWNICQSPLLRLTSCSSGKARSRLESANTI